MMQLLNDNAYLFTKTEKTNINICNIQMKLLKFSKTTEKLMQSTQRFK